MSIFTKNTPLKVWHLIVFLLVAALIYFAHGTWRQVQINKANIQSIAQFLNQAQQTAVKAPSKEGVKKD